MVNVMECAVPTPFSVELAMTQDWIVAVGTMQEQGGKIVKPPAVIGVQEVAVGHLRVLTQVVLNLAVMPIMNKKDNLISMRL